MNCSIKTVSAPSAGRHLICWLLALMVAACGGGGGDVVPGATQVSGTAPAPVPVPATGGLQLVVGGLGGPGNLDGVGTQARLNYPSHLAMDSMGRVLVTSNQTSDSAIRRITQDGQVSTLLNLLGTSIPLGQLMEMRQLLPMPGGDMLLVGNGKVYRLTAQGQTTLVFSWEHSTSEPSFLKFATDSNGQLYAVQLARGGASLALFGAWSYRVVKVPNGSASPTTVQVVAGSEVSGAGVIDIVADVKGRIHLLIGRAGQTSAQVYRLNDSERPELTELSVVLNKVLPPCLPLSSGYLRLLAIDGGGNIFLQASQCTFPGDVSMSPNYKGTEFIRYRPSATVDRISLPSQQNADPFWTWLSNGVVDGDGNFFIGVSTEHAIYKVSPTGSILPWAGLPGDQSVTQLVAPTLPTDSKIKGLQDVVWEPVSKQLYLHVSAQFQPVPDAYTPSHDSVLVRMDGAKASGALVLRRADIDRLVPVYPGPVTVDGQGGFFAWGERYDGLGRRMAFERPRLPVGLNANLYGYVPSHVRLDANGWVTENYTFAIHKWRLNRPQDSIFVGPIMSPFLPQDGSPREAKLGWTRAMTMDSTGMVYFVDEATVSAGALVPYRLLRRMSPDGRVTTVTGTNGEIGTPSASQQEPIADLAVDKTGHIYLADPAQHVIRKVSPDGTVTVAVGQPGRRGLRLGALPGGLDSPLGIDIDDNNVLYIVTPGTLVKVQLPQ
jgi:hypothetical protein